MKEKLIQELKKRNFDKDNYMGVVYVLDNNENAIEEMLKYLEEGNKTRNEIFEYAFAITNTQYDEIVIE